MRGKQKERGKMPQTYNHQPYGCMSRFKNDMGETKGIEK